MTAHHDAAEAREAFLTAAEALRAKVQNKARERRRARWLHALRRRLFGKAPTTRT